MWKKIMLVLLAILFFATSCAPAAKLGFGSPEGPGAYPAPAESYDSSRMETGFTKEGEFFEDYPVSSTIQDSVPASVERVVIKNANLTIVVADPAAAMETISKLAVESGGFVVSSNLYKTTKEGGLEVPEVNMTIRVPSTDLESALATIKSLVSDPEEDIRSENISGQDVTRDYTDLKSRLRNLEDTEKQLKEILEKAETTEDVMVVFNQLTQVREQIELIKGQMQYYEESARLSAISVTILASEGIQPLTIGRWQPVGIARDAIQALISAIKFLANLFIWTILFIIPVLFLILLPAWILWKLIRQLIRNRKTGKLDKVERVVKKEEKE